MEDTLRVLLTVETIRLILILILVLMEDTLRAHYGVCLCLRQSCLNPCFNGKYSQRVTDYNILLHYSVLILVLMEDTLRVGKEAHPIPYV